MRDPFPAEPVHAQVSWNEEDNQANIARAGIDFGDIASGFSTAHIRTHPREDGKFVALIKVNHFVLEVIASFDAQLTLHEARLAKKNAQNIYNQTLFGTASGQ